MPPKRESLPKRPTDSMMEETAKPAGGAVKTSVAQAEVKETVSVTKKKETELKTIVLPLIKRKETTDIIKVRLFSSSGSIPPRTWTQSMPAG
jgi:hypothetical protein